MLFSEAMSTMNLHHLSDRYTRLSDRFRSLWTFYQFLGGLFKHQERGGVPKTYDFQELHRRLQELVPNLGQESNPEIEWKLREMDRELSRIHAGLLGIEAEFAPSLLRRFFDHLKRQDEKILVALVKFYLMSEDLEGDNLDKLDILLTRLAEVPLEDGRVLQRDTPELRDMFGRLAAYGNFETVDGEQRAAFKSVIERFRSELDAIPDFETLLTSDIYDRWRDFKHQLGPAFLTPELAVDVVATNILAKNTFLAHYRHEETKILEDTNRIYEIERYLERHPDFAHPELRRHIETFRKFRNRYDAGRKEDNLKREDLLELRQSIHRVLAQFDPVGGRAATEDGRAPTAAASRDRESGDLSGPMPVSVSSAAPQLELDETKAGDEPEAAEKITSLTELLPPDPLLSEALHKIMFSLELVAWDHPPERAIHLKELHNLQLEPWEVEAYRRLSDGEVPEGTLAWELERFFLTSAALRVRMEDEAAEIARLTEANSADRLFEALEHAAQSLERGRDVDRRFQWFTEDMLYRGNTERLEPIYRSRFRFLQAYSRLWLDHQEAGGITPL